LDFSLQLEIFTNVLWSQRLVRDYLMKSYRHLIYDNVEEDMPRAHDIVRDWLADFDSALLLYDEHGGFRQFLGADMQTGWALRDLCNDHIALNGSFVMSESVAGLSEGLTAAILPSQTSNVEGRISSDAVVVLKRLGSETDTPHFYPELLDAVVGETQSLITNSLIPPSEIVILAPYLSDALRFSITNRLEAKGIPWRTYRPSRSLRDEPASHALITLAALAHPYWDIHPPKFDVAYSLMQSIDGLDLIRAQLLAEIVYRQRDLQVSPFEQIKPDVQERITFSVGNRYSVLRDWILAYRESDQLPLDHFLRKLFGEVLSQPGYGFHSNFDSVRVAASLVESVKKFRNSLKSDFRNLGDFGSLGQEYIQMLQDGVIAASYVESWRTEDKDAILVAPAYTFLMMNRPVRVQFWLDPGSSGWYERLAQPLTHPHVLSRDWQAGRMWTDADDVQYGREAMARLVAGLSHRCRERVYLGIAELGESGFEQRGELLRAFQKVL
jgi:hypothetical protein